MRTAGGNYTVVVGGFLAWDPPRLYGHTLPRRSALEWKRGSGSVPWDNVPMDDKHTETSAMEAARQARAKHRREHLVANRAPSFEAAAEWDLDFWQSLSPQERLSAFVHLRRDVELALAARAAREDAGQ